ncbi:MAG: SNF2-related protein, partial [Parachlamydiaceae bacterium]
IYVKGQGFFSKSSFETNLPLNTPIKEHDVAAFIRKNERELKLIPGFFLERPPIEKATLDIYPVEEGIEIVPKYQFEDEFKHKKYHFFDDYLYIENRGFFPYSPRHFLPNAFRAPLIIHENEYPKFFSETLKTLSPYIEKKDESLICPKNITFSFSYLEWDDEAKSYKGELLINGIALPSKEKRFHFTKAGLIDIELEPLKTVFRDIAKNRPYFSSLDILKLLALTDVKADLPILKEFRDLKPTKLIHHEALKSTLRPYQEVGVNWLWFLYTHRLSGLLSDDMGLGKTHQAMGLMASIQAYKKDAKFLVVCPTSVLHHWEDKLKQYFPTLRHFTFHGLKRDFTKILDADLVITSYGILRNEIDKFKSIPFELAVFDEIQLAKNHLSRIHLSLKQIKASTRIGLTGTPLENRLRELKALFDIVLPGLMPPEQIYIESFVKPIEKGEDPERKASLSRLIKPF